MTGPHDRAEVTLRFADDAISALVVDAARAVDGVVRLQRRPVAAARRPGRRSDASAVTVSRGVDGIPEIEVRLVSTLVPTPLEVVAGVVDAVCSRLAVVGHPDVRVEVTVTDVQR